MGEMACYTERCPQCGNYPPGKKPYNLVVQQAQQQQMHQQRKQQERRKDNHLKIESKANFQIVKLLKYLVWHGDFNFRVENDPRNCLIFTSYLATLRNNQSYS
jgi:hypothetical protein